MGDINNPTLLVLFLSLVIAPIAASVFMFFKVAIRRKSILRTINLIDRTYPAAPKYNRFISLIQKVASLQEDIKAQVDILQNAIDEIGDEKIKNELLPPLKQLKIVAQRQVVDPSELIPIQRPAA